jgi:phosphotransferase system IIB component
VTIEGLMKAKSLVEELGGFENVMNALNALKRLGD